MKSSIACIQTKNASRYLQQLCKHFGHKVPVEFSTTRGWVEFPFGWCDLSADEAQITLKSTAQAANLPKLEDVMASHLSRFAFRENPRITWQPNKKNEPEE